LKPEIVGSGRNVVRLVIASAALLSLAACGSYSTRGAGDGFVGTWSCPTLPAAVQTIVITENLDNSLILTTSGDAGSDLCATDEWVYSGSTVTMQNETSCLGGITGDQLVTVKSFKMTVNGSTLIVNASETLSAPDAAAPVEKLSLVGTCKQQ
jgi:hypothetical protein